MTNELIIGLGGQGGRSIQELRRTIELRRKDYDSIIAAGAKFDYLYIDSSADILHNNKWSVFGKNIALEANQVIQLKSNGASPDMEQIVNYPNIKPWIGDIQESFRRRSNSNEETARQMLQTMNGAGQLRRYGRALFAMHAHKIRSVIKAKIDALKEGRGNDVNFRIFCTLGGGTGSGSLIDMITLIQSIVGEDKTTQATLTVYAYVGGAKAEAANSGSFYENQYCSLRDLNALAVDSYHPFVTGMPVQDERDCYFHRALPINRVYLASDFSQGTPSLDTQITSMAASCFDSIVYGYKYTKETCLRAISDEDLVDVTPGETDNRNNIVRSYRFSTMGSRRWRVPTTQIRQLLTTDTEDRVWNAMLKGSAMPEGMKREVKAPDDFSFDYFLSSLHTAYQKIEDELLAPVTNMANAAIEQKRTDADVLNDITTAAKNAVEAIRLLPKDQQKKLLLVPEYKKTVAVLETELLRSLDKAITWDSKTDVWGIEDVAAFLLSFRTQVATWATTLVPGASTEEVDKTALAISDLMAKREKEWDKLGPLSISCTKLAPQMLDAHSQDARSLVINAIRPYKRSIVKELSAKVEVMIRSMETSVNSLKTHIEAIQAANAQLGRTLEKELKTHTSSDGLNIKDVYEYDADNLKKIRLAMNEQGELFESEMYRFSELFRKAVGDEKNLITCNSESLDHYVREMRIVGLNTLVERVHDAAKEAEALVSVLVGDIVERLSQIGGPIEDNWEHRLGNKVRDFMANVPISAEVQGNDGLMSPQQSPAAAIVIGLPAGSKNPDLVDWLRKKIEVSKPTKFTILGGRIDFYEHSTPEEIRVLYIPYWFPCRFASVLEFVEGKYRETLEKNDFAKLYFANYDESGMDSSDKFNRPSLTKSGEEDSENVAKTELAEKLYITYKDKKRPVCVRTENGVKFAVGVDNLDGIVYAKPYADSQIKLPGQSYKTDLAKAIRLAITPAPDGDAYAAMLKDEVTEIYSTYSDLVESLDPGSREYSNAVEVRGWVREWLGL